MRFIVIGAVVIFVGAIGFYVVTLPKQTTPPIRPQNPLLPTVAGFPKQATVGRIASKVSPLLRQPLVPATANGQPTAPNAWSTLAATAPSLFTGVAGIITQEQKNSAAAEAAQTAQDNLLIQQAGKIPANGGARAAQPALLPPANNLSANPDISALDTANVGTYDDTVYSDTGAVPPPLYPQSPDSPYDPFGAPDLFGTDLPPDLPIDTFDTSLSPF